ncbi:MAG: chemotaxis response regulator protein-glutamate methylesterase [Clostridiales Family XIII bacterium]|jgi:two-component system chemotaxis response regulator CheB|nr:chemotaxis response regulator protein-glutamate methylesterase [Clostridiales Family XIII bacterium]
MSKIKVMVVDDSLLFREIIIKGLEGDNEIEVVGFSADPFDAKDKIPKLAPDVMTLDIEMPKMDGIKFLRKLLPQYPLPVIVVSSLRESVFEALDAGAFDFIAKPDNVNGDANSFLTELRAKILAASSAQYAFRRNQPETIELTVEGLKTPVDPARIIAIGASTGGTEAINSILTKFSSNMPGIVIVQHMPPGFTQMYAQRLNTITNLQAKEAEDGDDVLPGRILIAPGDFHMELVRKGTGYAVKINKNPKVNGHRPSVDVLFDSVAKVAGKKALGVILTGMGADGATGLKRIRSVGGYTIGQDERSSVVYGMPMAAYMTGAVMAQLPLYRIADEICRILSET